MLEYHLKKFCLLLTLLLFELISHLVINSCRYLRVLLHDQNICAQTITSFVYAFRILLKKHCYVEIPIYRKFHSLIICPEDCKLFS